MIRCTSCPEVVSTPNEMVDHLSDEHSKNLFKLNKSSETHTCICDWCESEFQRKAHNIGNSQYCGRNCFNKSQRDNNQTYSKKFREVRKKAMKREGGKCRRCGFPNEKHRNAWGPGLEGHHIVKAKEFENTEHAHELHNISMLCKQCHNFVEPESD